jgi:flagellar hook assembly protein FlgD
MPTANLAGTPTELVYGSGFGVQAFCAQPNWSPDGQEITFIYTVLQTSLLGTEIQSNIYKVSVNGGNPVQLTSFSNNEIASNPSYSPNGKNVAFTHLKSSNNVFLLSDLINQTYESNIYATSSGTGGLGKVNTPIQLTYDGNSLDPSWGVVNTTVDVAEKNDVIKTYELKQNYPNPFNPETSISFTLPKQTYVKLSIYDILGKEIYNLTNQILPGGPHQLTWKGTDLFENPVPSGIYVYKLQTDSFVAVKKMLFVR